MIYSAILRLLKESVTESPELQKIQYSCLKEVITQLYKKLLSLEKKGQLMSISYLRVSPKTGGLVIYIWNDTLEDRVGTFSVIPHRGFRLDWYQEYFSNQNLWKVLNKIS